jgi:hypothetical protein
VGWTVSAKSHTLLCVLFFLSASVGILAGTRMISSANAENLVRRQTGDVWDAMACTQIASSTLSSRQSAIRVRSGVPAEALKALQQRSPDNCTKWGEILRSAPP